MNAPVVEPLVVAQREESVLRLMMNRAAARNALSEALMHTLQKAFE